MPARPKIFLLSPARCDGKRAAMLLNPFATFGLAVRLRTSGAALGEVFSFLSGLYFRGKLAYSSKFSSPPIGDAGAYIITTNRGLVAPLTNITRDDLQSLSGGDINANDLRYREPLERDLRNLRENDCEFILLGSVASAKYVDILLNTLGPRLVFPIDFVGRGDMSRGGLLLRCVNEQRELAYAPVAGAMLHGQRPPKLSFK